MHIDRLISLRGELERLEPLLEARGDDDAEQLACAVKAMRREVASYEASPEHSAAEGEVLMSCGLALVDRVRQFDRTWSLDWFTVDDGDDTIILDRDVLREMIDGMAPGATSPPTAVALALEESQMIGKFSTVPAGPPEDFDDVEASTGDFLTRFMSVPDEEDDP